MPPPAASRLAESATPLSDTAMLSPPPHHADTSAAQVSVAVRRQANAAVMRDDIAPTDTGAQACSFQQRGRFQWRAVCAFAAHARQRRLPFPDDADPFARRIYLPVMFEVFRGSLLFHHAQP